MRRTMRWIVLLAACVASSGCFTVRVYSWPAPMRPCMTQQDMDWAVDRFRDEHLARTGRVPSEIDERTTRIIASGIYCQKSEETLR